MDGKTLARIVAALVLLAAVAGIAFFAFNAGVAQGSPVTIQAPNGQTGQGPYPYYGYGMPWHRFPFFFGFGFLWLLIPLFFVFLAFRALRFLFWGPRWGWGHPMHGHGPWGRYGDQGVPPMFEEWHKRAHGESPQEDKG